MYNRFSDYYDALTFDIDYKKYAQNIFNILKSKGKEKADILEIGCGTGNLTYQLASKGHNITAFDNSVEMLNIAFPKLIDFENVNLIMADMYKFNYQNYEFDAIITLLDVLNYILDENKLKKLFEDIYSGLKAGGCFIFDLNSEDKLLKVLANNTYVYERDNIFYTWENTQEGDLIEFNLNFFIEEDGKYERFQERQVERYYPINYIIKLLQETGFKDISYIDEDSSKEYTEKTQRILFQASKANK